MKKAYSFGCTSFFAVFINFINLLKRLDFIGFFLYYGIKVEESGGFDHESGAKWWIS